MIIEFTGLPASGKTYISELLTDYLHKRFKNRIPIYNCRDLYLLRAKKYRSKIKLLFKYLMLGLAPINLMIICHICKLKSNFSEKVFVIKMYFNTLLIYEIIDVLKEIEKKTIFLLHEGYIHSLFALFVTVHGSPPLHILKKYINRRMGIDLLIFIQCSAENSYSRLEKRGWFTRMKKYAKQEKLAFIRNFAGTGDQALKNLKLYPVLTIQNDYFPNEDNYGLNFKKIYDYVNRVIS